METNFLYIADARGRCSVLLTKPSQSAKSVLLKLSSVSLYVESAIIYNV